MSFGYLLRIKPGFLLLVLGIINIPMYMMELRHMITTNFKITLGEIGPVESKLLLISLFIVEFIFSLFLFVPGVIGTDKLDLYIDDVLNIS
jgi:hypothetical protein